VPRVISGQRIARSLVTPTGAANTVSRVLDFQLSADQGIEISAVLGGGQYSDSSPAVSDTVPAQSIGHHTLHLEEGATETFPVDPGGDADDTDTEVFWAQAFGLMFIVGSTVTFGAGGGVHVTPSGLVTFPFPILSPRNITHKGVTGTAGTSLEAWVMIYYHFVEFSNAELGVLLARR